jgi:hypothetical protein
MRSFHFDKTYGGAFFLALTAFRLREVAAFAFTVELGFLVLPFVVFFLASVVRLRDKAVFFSEASVSPLVQHENEACEKGYAHDTSRTAGTTLGPGGKRGLRLSATSGPGLGCVETLSHGHFRAAT